MAEVLAPCGDRDALRMAVAGGADAVYLGLNTFSARAAAANFSPAELREAADYAHAFGVKVYVALNTLLTDRELVAAEEAVRACVEAKVDGVIVQDIGLLSLLAETTDLPLHLSTQAGVYNEEGAKFARSLGAVRVVLARESEREEAERIRALGLEVEVFVHGALCTSFSGNCYLSSFLSDTSGNRGRCRQPCRLPYTCAGEKGPIKGFLLSSKDECLAERAAELCTDSLKIEGRLKRPEYAGECARVYRRALDGGLEPADLLSLKKLYNRGDFIPGLADGRKGVVFRAVQGHYGVPAGRIRSVKGRAAVAERTFSAGDCCKVLRGGVEVGAATAGRDGALSVSAGVRPGDELRLTTDARQLAEIAARTRTIPVDLVVYAYENRPLRVRLSANGVTVEAQGETLQPARSAPADFAACFARGGVFPFALGTLTVEGPGGFVPKAKLNELRRQAYGALFAKLAERPPRRFEEQNYLDLLAGAEPAQSRDPSADKPAVRPERIAVFAAGGEMECRMTAAEDFDLLVYAPKTYFTAEFYGQAAALRRTGKPVYLDVPLFLYRADFEKFRLQARAFDGICAHNPAAAQLAKERNLPLLLDADCNLFNARAAERWHRWWAEDGVAGPRPPLRIVLSEELNGAQAEALIAAEAQRGRRAIVRAFGRQVLMTLNHCAARETLGGSCADCRAREMAYRSESGRVFPLERVRVGNESQDGSPILAHDAGEHCYFRLLNGPVTDKRGELAEREKAGGQPLDLLFDYSHGGEDGRGRTLGHWKRKVR